MIDGAGFSPPYDFSLVGGLEAAGAEVRLAMLDEAKQGWENPDALVGVRPSRFGKTAQRIGKAVRYAAFLRDIGRLVERWRPHVVHLQWLPLPLIDRRFVTAMKGRIPLVHTLHNTTLYHGASPGLQGVGVAGTWPLFDRVVVHSEYSRRAALRAGMVREDQVRVIPHGAFDYYGKYATDVVRAPGPVQLLFAGTIKSYKGLDILIESLSVLSRQTPPGSWHLTVAGQPALEIEGFRALLTERGLTEYVTWSLRHQSERELGRLFVGAHVVVLPYREIDQSGVLLAAVGVHRAVVASRVGAFPELLQHEQHGLLVPPGDPVALGEALARLVLDRPLRDHCELQMKRLAGDTLHWSTIGRTTLDMYRELTAS